MRLKCLGKLVESLSTDAIISDKGRLHTPPPEGPAKRFVSETAKAFTKGLVKPVADQLVPLSVERKTPPLVPAKRFVPETAKAYTTVLVKPAADQLMPLLVERKTPP